MDSEKLIRVKFVNRGQTSPDPHQWLRQFPGRNPVWGNCHFIFDPNERDYDWYVVEHDLPAQPEKKQSTATEQLACPSENTLFITREPSSVNTYGSSFLKQFRYVLTGQEDWALKHRGKIHSQPALRWYYGESFRGIPNDRRDFNFFVENPPVNKTKIIATVCSTKAQKHTMHFRRVQFIERLNKLLPEMDRFGEGFNEIADKATSLDDYKYHIAIENHFCDHWWTEKLSDSFLGHTLPFYHGAPNADEYFPEDSYIPINIYDFEGSVKIIKDAISNNEYEKRIESIEVARERCLYKYSTFAVVSKIVQERHVASSPNERKTIIRSKHNIRKNPLVAIQLLFEKGYIRIRSLINKLA